MTKVTHNIVATVGKYMKDGQEKNRYQNMGKLFLKEDGSVFAKIDCIPVATEWNGFVNFYKIEDNKKQDGFKKPQSAEKEFVDDKIPF
jgi:hypothetical protein